ncbi:MAG: glycoside hydrolase family 97 catalytic domain-containing protein, partial [Kiritimatiellae bacterium]|nr:glycoside hydrolase family 97 catalytic domain-containing protein [Kiritimatiellia bacterium]
CKDEFLDGPGDGWQSQLYVREARRMVGDYVMTEHECRGERKVPRPVAMGAYTMDSHNVRRVVTEKGNTKNEGDVQDHGRYSAWGPDAAKRAKGGRMKPYGIDYGAITPKRCECANLLVPVCLSASHMAFGSIRMEPVFFALGQAAGTAASMAAANGAPVQDVPYAELRDRLIADGQVISLEKTAPAPIPAPREMTLVNSAVSPDRKNEIRLYSNPLAYEVMRDGVVVVAKTEIGLKMNDKCVKEGVAKPCAVRPAKFSGFAPTSVYKKGKLDLSGNETLIDFGDWAVRLVARNDGVAYRFETKKPGIVDGEKADITLPNGARCWFNRTERGTLGCEGKMPEFADASALKTDAGKAIYLPFVYSSGVNGKTVAVVDADLHDYPVWNFGDVEQTEGGTKLKSLFAKYPKATERVSGWGKKPEDKGIAKGGRWVKVKETEDFIAKANAPRAFPWRAFALADSPYKLCEADIFYALATPAAKGADFSWVKPGKVAWDWWSNFDNGKGCTTKTYVRFIDFAAKNGVEYVIFDEGWSAKLDIWRYSPKVDVPYLIDYANKKGVGIILWMAWAQVYGEEEKVAEHFSKLGAKGFKVDFMDRGDAEIANFIEKFAAACAKHKMLIDYHGSYRPIGLQRTYPNVLTIEGIHGLEQMKWGKKDKDMCYNDVACFFIRMTAGPMDYTPGAMDNYKIGDYRGNGTNPGSVGTRCHQMALMALYESPLQMLSDSPTKYEQNMECFAFMAKTPVVWDATVGLGGTPETFAAAARKAKDGSWYAAGITNRSARDFEFKTDFLDDGEWKAEMFIDEMESDQQPAKYVHTTSVIKNGEPFKVHMASGGGFIVRFSR